MLEADRFAAIKAQLGDVPGIEALSVANTGGRLEFAMGSKVVAVRADAPDLEIEKSIRIIFGGKTVTDTPSTAATPVPAAPSPVAATAATGTATIPSNITGAAHATASIADLVKDARQSVQAGHDKIRANVAKVQQAAAALDGLGDNLGDEADNLLAMVGQFKNDLG